MVRDQEVNLKFWSHAEIGSRKLTRFSFPTVRWQSISTAFYETFGLYLPARSDPCPVVIAVVPNTRQANVKNVNTAAARSTRPVNATNVNIAAAQSTPRKIASEPRVNCKLIALGVGSAVIPSSLSVLRVHSAIFSSLFAEDRLRGRFLLTVRMFRRTMQGGRKLRCKHYLNLWLSAHCLANPEFPVFGSNCIVRHGSTTKLSKTDAGVGCFGADLLL
jgi:hypothetical protein